MREFGERKERGICGLAGECGILSISRRMRCGILSDYRFYKYICFSVICYFLFVLVKQGITLSIGIKSDCLLSFWPDHQQGRGIVAAAEAMAWPGSSAGMAAGD
jgi:hypothetical protein